MAHDSFRSQPAPEQPGFYDYSDTHYSHPAEPHQHSHLHHHPPEYERTRPRGTSNSRLDEFSTASTQYQSSQQPINDAVTSAFSKAETTNHLPPEILNQITSQITASVIQQLKASNLDTKAANTNYPPATSPSTHSGSSPPPAPGNRHVYTPPSPHRPSDDLPLDSPTSQAKFPNQSFGRASPPLDRRAASPLSQVSQAGWSTYREKEKDRDVDSRPKGPIRLDTETEETTLERIWGQLFDVENHPTLRLGQFLRGIAIHLIEDYEPMHSLVITPAKMQRYYEDTKLPSEIYPWEMIFDDRTSSISRLYREIEAQHHLVQERYDERPDIPGLTPVGFERWVTLLLQAHPDQEFQRLQKAVLDMPISNPDDKKERFPKEISRRLFPKDEDLGIRDRLERAMITHCNVNLPVRVRSNPDSTPVPPPHQQEPSVAAAKPAAFPPPPPPMSSTIERERQPYSTTSSEVSNDDMPTPQPIERERQPYVAQPGAGKNYDDVNRPPAHTDYKTPTPKTRSESVASQNRPEGVNSKTRPISIHQNRPAQPPDALPIPETVPAHHRSNSVRNHESRSRRRSPSANPNAGDFRRSDGDISNYTGTYGSYSSAPSADVLDDGRRYRDYREPSVREDPRSYDSQRGRYAPPVNDPGLIHRQNYPSDEEYYRAGGRSIPQGSGYDYNQQYPPSYR